MSLSSDRWAAQREFVARALRETDGKPVTAMISVPAPFAPLSTFLRALPRDLSFLWDGAEGSSFAGGGAAFRIDLEGEDRIAQLRRAVPPIWSRLVRVVHPECAPSPPRLFGGLSFEARGGRHQAPWDEFSDGCFTLPRWSYERIKDDDEGRGIVTLAVHGDRDRGMERHAEFLEQLDRILEAFEEYEGQSTNFAAITIPRIHENAVQQLDFDVWHAHIERIRSAIGSGAFGKIVAGRACEVELPRNLDDVDVLGRLAAEPGCTRFAFRRERSSFIAASPETLLAKRGNTLRTQALAGTIKSLGSELPMLSQRSGQLTGSNKDQAEHAFVVREIMSSLAPFANEIQTPPRPAVVKIRNILHLNTPIVATLRDDVAVPDLVAALHPTPAVGGTPKRDAAKWIVANEPCNRGWYTGTVGWLDATNDASFVVAIRCGLLSERRAYVYTGAGIVADSDPAAEYAETELKQLPLLRALGVIR